jgi:hypothetical protein
MSEPRHAKRGADAGPRPAPAPSEQPPAGGDRVGGRKRGRHVVPAPLPAPDPKDPYTPGTPRPGRPLTRGEMFVSVPGDPDFPPGHPSQFLKEDFYRFAEWDQAIDREPELEW